MNCKECGVEIDEDEKFCEECADKIAREEDIDRRIDQARDEQWRKEGLFDD